MFLFVLDFLDSMTFYIIVFMLLFLYRCYSINQIMKNKHIFVDGGLKKQPIETKKNIENFLGTL